MSAVNPKHPARCGCAQCGYLEALAGIAERPCVCDSPNCGCSDPSVAVCRTCGGRVSLRLSANPVTVSDTTDKLLAAYREKRAVDGFNGRVWDAVRHWQADAEIARLEAQVSAKAATVSEPTDRKRHLAHCPAHPLNAMCICNDEEARAPTPPTPRA